MLDKHTKKFWNSGAHRPNTGGAKRPHESSDSDKEQPTMGSTLKNIEERQPTIVGLANAGWI